MNGWLIPARAGLSHERLLRSWSHERLARTWLAGLSHERLVPLVSGWLVI